MGYSPPSSRYIVVKIYTVQHINNNSNDANNKNNCEDNNKDNDNNKMTIMN